MIRLDGNSLAAFRGAGVAGTVQSVAGCELFGAARMPSWASPYSAAATAALKAQFPTQWATIRDYGFSHPEIVGYMNAYAPEDAKIAYSLVPTMGYDRWLIGTAPAYINSKLVPNTNTKVKDVFKIIQHSGGANAIFGSRIGYGNSEFMIWAYTTDLTRGWDGTGQPTVASNVDIYTKHTVEMSNGLFAIDGVQSQLSTGTLNSTQPCFVFCLNTAGSRDSQAASKLAHAMFEMDGHTFVPFICQARTADKVSTGVAQAAGTCGMIDLLTGIFYPNANSSGSFTISEEPAA